MFVTVGNFVSNILATKFHLPEMNTSPRLSNVPYTFLLSSNCIKSQIAIKCILNQLPAEYCAAQKALRNYPDTEQFYGNQDRVYTLALSSASNFKTSNSG